MSTSPRYNLGFTAAPLRPELARIVAAAYLDRHDWGSTKQWILESNALQATTKRTGERLELEFRNRLRNLTEQQLAVLANGTGDESAAIAWLAAFRNSEFAYEFAAEVLRDKIESHDPILRRSDYEAFIEMKSPFHKNLAKLSDSTKDRIRQALLRMLREAGLLGPGADYGTIQRPILSPRVREAVESDNPRWLAGFLVPDAEIGLH